MNKTLKSIKGRIPYLFWLDHKPIHKHDCNTCTFLGNYRDISKAYDLYWHDDPIHPELITVVARYGNDENYISGLSFLGTTPALQVAFARKVIRENF